MVLTSEPRPSGRDFLPGMNAGAREVVPTLRLTGMALPFGRYLGSELGAELACRWRPGAGLRATAAAGR